MTELSLKDYWCPKKMKENQKRVLLRIMKDLQEVKNNPLPFVVAEPINNDLYHWHGNIKGPDQSPFEGGVFHFSMVFQQDYPLSPPLLRLFSPLSHHMVLGYEKKKICLELIEARANGKYYSGWSPVYSVYSVLCQLQSFLLDGLQSSGNTETGYNITFSQRQTSQWKDVFENRDERGEGTLNPHEIRELLLEVGERKPSEEELFLYYHMLHLPKDQQIDFSTFLKILKLKREYRKVVETFNRHICNDPNCSHEPQNPYPRFPDAQQLVKKESSIQKIISEETKCFFTKHSYKGPNASTLGVGISFLRNTRNGEINKVFASEDLISLNAFRKYKIKDFPGKASTFSHWFPVYLEDSHGEKAMHLISRCLGIICSGSHRDFNPEMVLQIIPRIMGSAIQKILAGNSSEAVRALHTYTRFHHLMLVYLQRYPQTGEFILKSLKNFANDPSSRIKDVVPNISDTLSLLAFLPLLNNNSKGETPDPDKFVDVKRIFAAALEETNIRSVLWIFKKYPELTKVSPDEKADVDRIEKSFDKSKAGFQLLLFHQYLFKNVANEGTIENQLKNYSETLGKPSSNQIEGIISEFRNIEGINSYEEVYIRLGLPVPEKVDIFKGLLESIKISTKYNYHCKREISVQSADEYLKEKLKDFISLDELVDEKKSKLLTESEGFEAFALKDDEEMYKDLCIRRFGSTEIIEESLTGIDKPWRHWYLKLNVEDMLGKFNENPDFKRFYRVLDLSSHYLRSVEFLVVPVTNIKSNFFYLTALLNKLRHLEKFTVRRGENLLDLKGCKALCKGLKNNPDSIRILDLNYCHINSERIKILEDGLLSSKKLISLNMEGNPLGDIGARSIAKVLREHEEITHLNVSSCGLNDDGARVLAEAFYHNHSLKVVQISKNAISNLGMKSIFGKLAYSRTIERLEVLCNQVFLSSDVGEELTRLFEVSTSLKEINLYRTDVTNLLTDKALHGLSMNRSLETLDLGSSNLNGNRIPGIGHAVARNRNIKHLKLESSNLPSSGLVSLSLAIYDSKKKIDERNKAKNFRELTESEIKEDLRPRGCSLESINLSNNAFSVISPDDILAVDRLISLTKTIVNLDLSGCALGVSAGEALGRGLMNHPTLITLNLSKNSLGEYGVKKLCKGLGSNNILEELNISRNGMSGRGASGVAHLLENQNSKLKTLNMYGNLIGIEGARFIATSLETNSSVTDLDLGLNRMRPKGVAALIESLPKNSTLKILRLKQNFVNDKVAMELCDVLIPHPSILRLCLAGNKVKDTILKSVVNSLKEAKQPKDVDIALLLDVTQKNRLKKTVYCTPLPKNASANGLKKIFYDGGCGAIVNVSIHTHSIRKTFSDACYAFVEFAEEDSVQLALDIGSEGSAKIGRAIFSVIQAQGKK